MNESQINTICELLRIGKPLPEEYKWFAQDLEMNNFEIRFPAEKIKDKVMIAYMDMFGNEKKELIRSENFKHRRGDNEN